MLFMKTVAPLMCSASPMLYKKVFILFSFLHQNKVKRKKQDAKDI